MYRKHIKFLVILLVITMFVVPGCKFFDSNDDVQMENDFEENGEYGEYEGEDLRDTVFYYQYGQKYIVPVVISVPWTEGIARATIDSLVSSPQVESILEGTGLQAPLPSGTEVIGLTIRDGLARIDFTEDVLDVREGLERSVLNSIIYSLTEFETVDEVEIMVEGHCLEEFPEGDSLEQPLNRKDINLEISDEVEDLDLEDTEKVMVYYCGWGEEGISLIVPVTRVVNRDSDLMEKALQELIKGPRAGTDLYSDISPAVKVNSLTVEEGLATVDFTEEFLDFDGGITAEENMLKQVTLTLTRFPDVEEVLILVNGQEPELSWGQPLRAPDMINNL